MSDLKDRIRAHFVKRNIKVVVCCESCGKSFGAVVTKQEYHDGYCELDCENRKCPEPKKPKVIVEMIGGWD